MSSCEHLDQIDHGISPSSFEGCSDCLQSGGQWVHLRMCLTCGRVGCCDSSPNRHASRHAAEHDHPLISSFEPGEEWSWCFVDELGMVIDSIPHPHRLPYPEEQGAPGQP